MILSNEILAYLFWILVILSLIHFIIGSIIFEDKVTKELVKKMEEDIFRGNIK